MRRRTQTSWQGRMRQRKGALAEQQAILALKAKGVAIPEPIATPIRILGTKKDNRNQVWHRIAYGQKVSGDVKGILPVQIGAEKIGIGVLAETKSPPDKLSITDFRKHQLPGLMEHHNAYGIALIVWVSDYGLFTLRYPLPPQYFRKGKPLTIEAANELEWNGDWQHHPGF